MKFTLEFNCDNGAFEDDVLGESAAVLAAVVRRLRTTEDRRGSLYDANGNNIGTWRLA